MRDQSGRGWQKEVSTIATGMRLDDRFRQPANAYLEGTEVELHEAARSSATGAGVHPRGTLRNDVMDVRASRSTMRESAVDRHPPPLIGDASAAARPAKTGKTPGTRKPCKRTPLPIDRRSVDLADAVRVPGRSGACRSARVETVGPKS